MAKATTDTISKTVQKTVEEKVYVVTLSEEEAKSLFALTGIVGGSPLDTYSAHTEAFRKALSRAGLDRYIWFKDRFNQPTSDSIYAKNIVN